MAFKPSRQGEATGTPRKEVVGASVTADEKNEIDAGLEAVLPDAKNRSTAARLVLLTVARNPAVREVLLSHLPNAA